MQHRMWAAALGLAFGVALPASAEIIKGSMLVHGCEMS
jgi:hypothetical protein